MVGWSPVARRVYSSEEVHDYCRVSTNNDRAHKQVIQSMR